MEPDGELWERGEKIAQESEEGLGSKGKEDDGGGNYEKCAGAMNKWWQDQYEKEKKNWQDEVIKAFRAQSNKLLMT